MEKPTKAVWIIFSLGFLLATALIIAAARGDLWLDEIWSLLFVEAADKPWEILTRFRHDNNHVLNTVFLYIISPQNYVCHYRLLAIFSGIGSLVILAYIARRQGAIESLFVLFLAGSSYPLILYFSEARGYAPAIFCALVAFASLQKCLRRITLLNLIVFWSAMILGILAHLTFMMVIVALLCYTVVHEVQAVSLLPKMIIRACAIYTVPMVFLIVFYIQFVRHISIGGGPEYRYWDVISNAAGLLLGFPDGSISSTLAFLCFVGAVATGVYVLYRNGCEQWSFFLFVLFVGPALFLAVTRPQYLYFRYFIVCFPFFYLLLGSVLGWCYRSRFIRFRWVIIALIGLMIVGQAHRVIPLLQLGRGSYMAALSDISANSQGQVLRIGSDHDFRNKMLLSFYTRFLSEKKTILYIEQKYWAEEMPEWILIHSQDMAYQPPYILNISGIGNCRLFKQYRCSGVSGWNWFLYHQENTR